MLKNFLAKLPINTLIDTEITSNRILIPVDIDSKDFYKNNSNAIESNTFTDEKAIYIVSTETLRPFITSTNLLRKYAVY